MNRQEALEWLVQNVTKWPTYIFDVETNISWDFYNSEEPNEIVFCRDEFFDGDDDLITQQQWLDATDNMPHSDCESVFNK